MRMIIGYNDKTKAILFSDSWGAGHELKQMKMGMPTKRLTGFSSSSRPCTDHLRRFQ